MPAMKNFHGALWLLRGEKGPPCHGKGVRRREVAVGEEAFMVMKTVNRQL